MIEMGSRLQLETAHKFNFCGNFSTSIDHQSLVEYNLADICLKITIFMCELQLAVEIENSTSRYLPRWINMLRESI